MSFPARRASFQNKQTPALPYAPVIISVSVPVAQPVAAAQIFQAAQDTSAPPDAITQSPFIQSNPVTEAAIQRPQVLATATLVAAVGSAQRPPDYICAPLVPQPTTTSQVVFGQPASKVDSTPSPDQIYTVAAIAQPTTSAQVNSVPLVTITAPAGQLVPLIQSSSAAQPTTSAQVIGGITIGVPPAATSSAVAATVASAVAQNVYPNQVVAGWLVGQIVTVPVPDVIQSQAMAQPPTSAKVYGGITIGVAPPPTSSVVTATVAQAVAQNVYPNQVVAGWLVGQIVTVPVPDVIQSQAMAQPPTSAKVSQGITIGNPPAATTLQTFFVQARNIEQPVFGSRVIQGITIGNPPSTQALVTTITTAAPIGQNVYGYRLVFGQPAALVETVPLAILVKSVPYPQPTNPNQFIGGIRPSVPTMVPTIVQARAVDQPAPQSKSIPVFFISTIPKLPFIYGRSCEQPVTSVRVLGGIVIGTAPPIVPTSPGLQGMTSPSSAKGKTAPSQLQGLTDPSELSGV